MEGQSFSDTDDRLRRSARWCFRATLVIAMILAMMVLAAPRVALSWPHGAPPWLTLLAEDQTVRRTWVIAAVGLWLTALIWFRGAGASNSQEQSP